MYYLKYAIFFTIIIIKSYADKVISDESVEQTDRKDKNTYSKVERRFLDNLDDETWHVSHLKDTDFNGRRAYCPEDTFEDKVRKYRKSLKNDGALVEYVSADALPFNETEMMADVCKTPDQKDMFQTALKWKANADAPQGTSNTNSKNDAPKADTKEKDAKPRIGGEEGPEKLNIATTTTKKDKNPSAKPPNARKASEYQFSSVEYYDETFDFDSSICPDAVEEIVLEIDHIRNYDVRCEKLMVWRSLE